jgi:hypothetical protein
MYKIQVRPPSGHELTTKNSLRYESISKTFRTIYRETICPSIKKHIRLYLAILACCLNFAVIGCGGVTWNPATMGAITPSPGRVTFGTVDIGQNASTGLSFTNKSPSPVTISKIDLSGDSYSLDGGSALPVTLTSGGTLNLNVNFHPAQTGMQTGAVTITSDSSTSPSAVVSLTGTGSTHRGHHPSLSAISCGSSSLTGQQTKACSVSLSAPAVDPLVVHLSSNNPAVAVPTAVTILAGASSTGFNAVTSAINSSQSVTLTASAGGVSQTDVLQLNPAISSQSGTSSLSLSATSLSFGGVIVNTAATKSVTLTSTGSAAVTVSAASVTGTGFSVSGATFPFTLNPGQAATLSVQFDPTASVSATGQLAVTSNSSSNPTSVIALSGTGTTTTAALTSTLSINATSVSFGSVVVNAPAIQSVTLQSTGTAAVTVNSATVAGTGFSLSGGTFPATLNPGQAVTLSVQFDPTVIGSATGQLTITSNSSINPTSTISLSGTSVAHQVELNWNAPSSSTDPIAGYHVYRSSGGSSAYQLLNSSVDAQTTYADTTVQSGLTYDYVVKSVDNSGLESGPSNETSITIP